MAKANEQIELLRSIAEAMGATVMQSDDLKKATRELKKAESDLFNEINKGGKDVDKLRAEYRKLYAGIQDLKDETKAAKSIQGQYEVALGKLERAIHTLDKSDKNYAKTIKELRKEVDSANIKMKQWEKTKKELLESNSKLISSLNSINSTLGKFTGGMAKMAAFLGVATFSLNDLAKTGVDYNRSVFELTRTQLALGKGIDDVSSSMAYAKKNTNLSRIQFAEFAKIVTTKFIGVKMSLKEVADMSKMLADTVGPSFEAQKAAAEDLLQIQNQMPSMYDKIVSGMKLVQQMNKSGGGTSEEKARVANLRNEVQVQQQLLGVSTELQDKTRGYLTEQNDAMGKSLEMEKRKQDLIKATQEAQLNFSQMLEGSMVKLYTIGAKIVNLFANWGELILGLGIGIPIAAKLAMGFHALSLHLKTSYAGATMLSRALNMMKAHPIMLIAAAVAAIGVGMYAFWKSNKLAREESEKQLAIERDKAEIAKKVAGLTVEQKMAYEELNKNAVKGSETQEELNGIHKANLNEVTKTVDATARYLIEQNKINKEAEANLTIINKIVAAYRARIDAATQFGLIDKEAMSEAIKNAERVSEQYKSMYENAIKVGAAMSGQEFDVKLSMNENASKIMSALSKEMQGLVVGSDKWKLNQLAIDNILSNQKGTTESIANITKARVDNIMVEVKQQEEITSAYEARLNTERQLMEAAQFGLGASVEMMQKQVDLAYTQMKLYDETDKAFEKEIRDSKILSDIDINRVKNAKTAAEAQSIINEKLGAGSKEAQLANKYASEHQNLQKKSMEQQLKIYELTKSIREGYLDAIREMSTGAGEFQKIIGTQEMGVTQLMDQVKDLTGENKLNTMKLGGITTNQEARSQVAGKYTAGGASFNLSKQQQESQNKDIWGYMTPAEQEAKTKAEAAKVGTGVAGGRETQYIQPEREGEKTKDEEIKIIEDGTYKALERYSKSGGTAARIRSGVAEQGFAKYEQKPSGPAFGYNQAKGTAAPPSAANITPSVRASSSGERLTTPAGASGATRATVATGATGGTEEEKFKKQQEEAEAEMKRIAGEMKETSKGYNALATKKSDKTRLGRVFNPGGIVETGAKDVGSFFSGVGKFLTGSEDDKFNSGTGHQSAEEEKQNSLDAYTVQLGNQKDKYEKAKATAENAKKQRGVLTSRKAEAEGARLQKESEAKMNEAPVAGEAIEKETGPDIKTIRAQEWAEEQAQIKMLKDQAKDQATAAMKAKMDSFMGVSGSQSAAAMKWKSKGGLKGAGGGLKGTGDIRSFKGGRKVKGMDDSIKTGSTYDKAKSQMLNQTKGVERSGITKAAEAEKQQVAAAAAANTVPASEAQNIVNEAFGGSGGGTGAHESVHAVIDLTDEAKRVFKAITNVPKGA